MLFFFLLIFFIKAYVVDTHWNCIEFKWVPITINICLYKVVDKKYTGYIRKTMELLDSALIGVLIDCVGV